MVRGLERFRAHFESYTDRYVLIGGTACSIALAEVGLDFRATKDLDIVLCVEALDVEFARAFWGFIHQGHYVNQQRSTGKRLFYRFGNPEDADFPAMLELFARSPDVLNPADGAHLTPIPVGEDASSLSAILLDDDYYHFIYAGKAVVSGLPVVKPEFLIPLKAKAWLELSVERLAGAPVDKKDIVKHRNDVFRLYQVISPDTLIDVPASIAQDMRDFLDQVEGDAALNLSSLGLRSADREAVFADLRRLYL